MDKFDKIIKQAVEGYEAPYNPQAWDNVSKDLGDSFDQMMKETANDYKAPYNPAAWEAVSSQIGSTSSAWKWITGSAAALALIFGSAYLLDNPTTDEDSSSVSGQSDLIVDNNDNTVENNTDLINTNVNDDEDESNSNGNEIIHPVDNDLDNNINPIDVIEEGNGNNFVQVIDPNEGNSSNDPQGNQVDNNSNGNNSNGVTSYDDANASFTSNESAICVGGKCIFTPEDVNPELIYVWNFGDGGLSSSQVGTHNFKRAGEYIVSLSVKHPRSNKTIASSKEVIKVNALPQTNFEWEQSNEVIPTVSFINLTDEASSWAWDIKGIKQSSRNEFEHTFRKAGKYLVELTAKNEFGCSNSMQKTIRIDKDYNLLAPTAFSPNGDFKNDEFIPEALKLMDVPFTMTIHDKGGSLVYTTQSVGEPWDGKYTKDNTPAPAGAAYIWRVVLINNNGEQEMYQGHVIII
jgi:gliding motility-associated-like protein